ncbi:hypothetical protein [Leptospira kanakyensis]|uniref:hypothetical protein n=1 Tax=Leptospira kanakyensis TaxID=2484968 RepID=UPI001FC96D2A|nr:hypothetical protein [Leptospira kanakyensis]
MEESQVSFLEGTQNFIKQSANLPAEQRVKQFEDLKKKTKTITMMIIIFLKSILNV